MTHNKSNCQAWHQIKGGVYVGNPNTVRCGLSCTNCLSCECGLCSSGVCTTCKGELKPYESSLCSSCKVGDSRDVEGMPIVFHHRLNKDCHIDCTDEHLCKGVGCKSIDKHDCVS